MYHFGFAPENLEETIGRLEAANTPPDGGDRPRSLSGPGKDQESGVELKHRSPEGVQIELSEKGWKHYTNT